MVGECDRCYYLVFLIEILIGHGQMADKLWLNAKSNHFLMAAGAAQFLKEFDPTQFSKAVEKWENRAIKLSGRLFRSCSRKDFAIANNNPEVFPYLDSCVMEENGKKLWMGSIEMSNDKWKVFFISIFPLLWFLLGWTSFNVDDSSKVANVACDRKRDDKQKISFVKALSLFYKSAIAKYWLDLVTKISAIL